MITLDLSILNQKGTPMFNSDTFANRPAFGIVGRIFISTDTKEFYRDTGTSWELIGGPGSGTITGSGAATQVAFWNGTSTISGSNNLYWDSTNNNLGINTNTPGNALDVHGGTISTLGAFNQTTATNNTLLAFLNSNTPLWRIGNFYTGGANDFSVFDVIGNLQQFTIVNTTGQTFVGPKTTAGGRLVVNSATADNHLQIVGANSPSIRIDNAGSGGTQRFVFGLATATNNFIQGATAGEFCISTQSSGAMLFGMWQTVNATEAMRISTANNLLIGSSVDSGQRLQVAGKVNSTGYFLNGMTAGSGALYWASDRVTLANYNVGGILSFEVNGGATAMTLFSTGNLALGSSTDNTNRFQVSGTSTFSDVINITSNTSTGYALNIIGRTTTGNASTINFFNNAASTRYGFVYVDSSTFEIGSITGSNIPLIFSTNQSERMRITSAGNLLVGTSVDNGNRLQISGSATFSSSATANDVYAGSGTQGIIVLRAGGAGAAGFMEIFTANGTTRLGYIGYNTTNMNYVSENSVNHVFQTNGNTERMRIKANGVINFSNVPTSSAGLVSGDIYQTAGVLNIVP